MSDNVEKRFETDIYIYIYVLLIWSNKGVSSRYREQFPQEEVQPECERQCTQSSNGEVKNAWSYTSVPPHIDKA